jgi:hypothetical protein
MCAVHCAWGACGSARYVRVFSLCLNVVLTTTCSLFSFTMCLDSVLNDLNMHGGHSEEFSR